MMAVLKSKGEGEDGEDMYVDIYVYVHTYEQIYEKQQ